MTKLTQANIATARAVLLTAAIAAVPLVPVASLVSFKMSGGGQVAGVLDTIGVWVLVVAFYAVAIVGGVYAVFAIVWAIIEGFQLVSREWSRAAEAVDELD